MTRSVWRDQQSLELIEVDGEQIESIRLPYVGTGGVAVAVDHGSKIREDGIIDGQLPLEVTIHNVNTPQATTLQDLLE